MGEESSEVSSYPLWDKWHDVAKPVNTFISWAIIGLSLLGWVLPALAVRGWGSYYVRLALRLGLVWMILGVTAGILYFIFCYKAVKDKDLTALMHVILIICEVLCWLAWWPVGAFMTLQFVMVGILSDVPFWDAFSK
ncbi:MAG: hypothetical protein HWN66_14125 [Candidatus Helarchaeota archaeon]|nr:hypothetical protein [Candidatus Helarchaeota archaeon]